MKLWFAVDTLEFLRRGGRIGAAQAWLGGALKIKPILTVEHEITPIERVRTSARLRAHGRLPAGASRPMARTAGSSSTSRRRAGPGLVERGREIFSSEPQWVSEIGPVIGTHVGPGLLGWRPADQPAPRRVLAARQAIAGGGSGAGSSGRGCRRARHTSVATICTPAGDRDGDQRAQNPEQRGADQDRHDHDQRVHVHRPAVHDGLEDVVLDLLVDDEDHHPDDRRRRESR